MQGVGTTKISRSVTDASCLERYLWTTVACNFHTMPRYAKIDQETMGSQRRLWRSSFTSYDWLWLNIYGPRSSCDCHPKPVAGLNSRCSLRDYHYTELSRTRDDRGQRLDQLQDLGCCWSAVSCGSKPVSPERSIMIHLYPKDSQTSEGISWYFYMCYMCLACLLWRCFSGFLIAQRTTLQFRGEEYAPSLREDALPSNSFTSMSLCIYVSQDRWNHQFDWQRNFAFKTQNKHNV